MKPATRDRPPIHHLPIFLDRHRRYRSTYGPAISRGDRPRPHDKRSRIARSIRLLAQNGHAACIARCPLSGAERKTDARLELFRF
jgi:hypothetical protein